MARRFLQGQNVTFGLSLVLFTFMLLPTFFVLVAVVVFFLLVYPGLQKSVETDGEQGVQPQQAELKN
ncbi:hypothetical protein N7520_002232 [Penicillium odoratum]|uniref:uncharacterized protein n=1 Tax=Penicillium odoratum TaxID=1167516 RepID=UPI0025472632|nr:uncharacterized protein N7520_002232 [Penicillium odoratum]KAJ5771703.1 hypothetical protein N7520_002232 [Penicillium odoratum]